MRSWILGLLALVVGGLLFSAPTTLFAPAKHEDTAISQLATPLPTIVRPLPSPTLVPTYTPLPPTATPLPPTATPLPFLGGEPAPVLDGELVMQTFSIDFYWVPGGLDPDVIRAQGMPAEEAVGLMSERMGALFDGRIAIGFEPPQQGECAIRGLTVSKDRYIRMFYEPNADPDVVLAILSHEFVHQLQNDFYGSEVQLRADEILLEGQAVFVSSPYFYQDEQGRPLYHLRARQALLEGRLLPLTTNLEEDCRTTTRNDIYNQWASFVEYLLLTYGREPFDRLYASSNGYVAGSADYSGIIGKTLPELEADWIAWLEANP